jgi:hypothetical protein
MTSSLSKQCRPISGAALRITSHKIAIITRTIYLQLTNSGRIPSFSSEPNASPRRASLMPSIAVTKSIERT